MLNLIKAGDEANTADFIEAIKLATATYNAPQLAIWLTTPQPVLNHWTPLQMLACGQARELLAAMKDESSYT